MPVIDDLIASIEVEKEAAEKRLAKNIKQAELILAKAQQEGRSNLTEDETAEVRALKDERTTVKDAIEGIKRKLADANDVKAEELERSAKQTEIVPAARSKPAYDQVMRVGMEERTYRPDTDRKGGAFIRDVCKQFLFRDVEAEHRLARHMQEERVERAQYLTRAVGTSAFTGLVVPQYLTEMYAPATAALRPFADICNKHDLPPEGMTVNISQITTAPSVALQANQNAAVSETNIDDTLLTENIQTAAGQQTISRQAIERGTGIEDVILNDLYRRYATTLDNTLLNQATTGLTNVANANTYTDTTPTAAELWPKLLGANAAAEAAFLAQAVPSHAIMHSRRWHWMQSQVGTSWPFMSQPGIPVQAGGVNMETAYNMGVRGMLPNGNKVIVDNNVATNLGTGTDEDEIYIVAADECHLWEDPNSPVFIRAEQTNAASLGVLLVLYGYFAYSFRRYASAQQKIAGSGLITPTF
jgi:HK97 family phage major capsid protein